MKQTEHYQLNQWEAGDRILMGDFNADNAKLDAALGALAQTAAEHTELIAGLGNCEIIMGSYVGTGTYGSEHPSTLVFPHKPVLVIIQPNSFKASGFTRMIMLRGSSWGYGSAQTNGDCVVAWGEKSVTWYAGSNATYLPSQQLNLNNIPYSYIALLVKE